MSYLRCTDYCLTSISGSKQVSNLDYMNENDSSGFQNTCILHLSRLRAHNEPFCRQYGAWYTHENCTTAHIDSNEADGRGSATHSFRTWGT